jgi:hypothetical protein
MSNIERTLAGLDMRTAMEQRAAAERTSKEQ